MIPHTPAAIGGIAQRLMTNVLPDLRTNYGVADIGLISALLAMVAQDFERAAEARLADIREMRDIFSDAADLLHAEKIAAHLRDACELPLHDLHISKLDEVHALHSQLLIDVHARVEQLADSRAAAQVNLRIWEHLTRHVERHRYDIAF
jgi:uncharacterized protein YicC (UPF0701 family)